MTRTRRIALAVALSLAIVLAGCSAVSLGGDDGPDVDPDEYDAETLAQEAQTSMEDVNSLTMEMALDMEIHGQMGQASMSMETEAAANYETRRIHYETLDMTVSQMGREQSVEAEAYLVGETMYIDVGDGWDRTSADGATWDQGGPEQQAAFLEDAEVTIEGAEVVNGEDTLIVSVEPSDAALEQLAAESAAQQDTSASSMEIESATVTQYIDADEPHYVRKSEVEMTAIIDGQTVEMDMTVTMDDLEDDVTIDVPDELE